MSKTYYKLTQYCSFFLQVQCVPDNKIVQYCNCETATNMLNAISNVTRLASKSTGLVGGVLHYQHKMLELFNNLFTTFCSESTKKTTYQKNVCITALDSIQSAAVGLQEK
jgi:hypothetical protein